MSDEQIKNMAEQNAGNASGLDLSTTLMVAENKTDAYRLGRCDGFIDGYHEGSKANEWHKDLPTEDVELAIIEVEDCGYLLCYYLKGIWYDKGSSAVCKDWITRNIKRWKEIVPLKIKED